MSPTALRLGPYRFFFFSNEGFEPPHIQVQRDERLVKFWLDPVSLAQPGRFAHHEVAEIETLVRHNEARLLEAWHDFFRH